MEIDDEEMDQLPSSSSGPKGDKKRFEVKKVEKLQFLCFEFSMIFKFYSLLLKMLSNDVFKALS